MEKKTVTQARSKLKGANARLAEGKLEHLNVHCRTPRASGISYNLASGSLGHFTLQ